MGWQAESLAWLRVPGNWPAWPVCPVKRRGAGTSFPECGIVRAGELAVYIINLFALETGPLTSQLEGVKKFSYESLEALVEDGWEVD